MNPTHPMETGRIYSSEELVAILNDPEKVARLKALGWDTDKVRQTAEWWQGVRHQDDLAGKKP